MDIALPAERVRKLLATVVKGENYLTVVEEDIDGILVGVRTSVAGRAVAVRVDVRPGSAGIARVEAAGRTPRALVGGDPRRVRAVIEEIFDHLEHGVRTVSL